MENKLSLSLSLSLSLAVKTASEMTYIVSSGALNSTPTNLGESRGAAFFLHCADGVNYRSDLHPVHLAARK